MSTRNLGVIVDDQQSFADHQILSFCIFYLTFNADILHLSSWLLPCPTKRTVSDYLKHLGSHIWLFISLNWLPVAACIGSVIHLQSGQLNSTFLSKDLQPKGLQTVLPTVFCQWSVSSGPSTKAQWSHNGGPNYLFLHTQRPHSQYLKSCWRFPKTHKWKKQQHWNCNICCHGIL